jgi:sugar phosphate permease
VGDPRQPQVLGDRPTRVRYSVLAFTTTMAVLLYLDRVCISVAGGTISADLGLNKEQMGFVFSAFFFAYALGQVPAGWLGDRLGGRRMLIVCVLGWSLCTALTGLATGLVTLLAIRLLFGLAQAGAYPIAARINSLWMPFSQRAFSSSVISLGGRAGGALAQGLTALLIVAWGGWQSVFGFYALPGLLWAALFWFWFSDTPASHPDCNDAEKDLITECPPEGTPTHGTAGAIPWGDGLRSLGLWMQCMTQFCTNVAWVFLITWLPRYLMDVYKVDLKESGLLASLPPLAGMTGCLLGGIATDWLTRRLGLKWGRNLLGMTTKFLAAVGALVALTAHDPVSAVLALSLSWFAVDLGLGATWAYFQDAGGPYVGTFLGWANMFGNLGAAVSPVFLGWLAQAFGWTEALVACSALYVAAGLCWLGIDGRIPIVRSARA